MTTKALKHHPNMVTPTVAALSFPPFCLRPAHESMPLAGGVDLGRRRCGEEEPAKVDQNALIPGTRLQDTSSILEHGTCPYRTKQVRCTCTWSGTPVRLKMNRIVYDQNLRRQERPCLALEPAGRAEPCVTWVPGFTRVPSAGWAGWKLVLAEIADPVMKLLPR